MKKQILKLQYFLILLLTTSPLYLLAQDEEAPSTSTTSTSKTEISVTETSEQWYASPWVWVVGAAVFILLLVALLSNRGADRTSDRVVVKKTVDRD